MFTWIHIPPTRKDLEQLTSALLASDLSLNLFLNKCTLFILSPFDQISYFKWAQKTKNFFFLTSGNLYWDFNEYISNLNKTKHLARQIPTDN